MTVGNLCCHLSLLLLGPARKWIARWPGRRRIFFEGVVVDRFDVSVLWSPVGPRVRRESIADPSYGRGDFASNLLIERDEFRSALTDIGSQGLRLCLPGGSLRSRPTSRTIGD
ncbi:hypothetical protein [Mycobacterium lentiflavum]|uniref:hypothetical protein n=1 Tax=Mycobacterium lentiflavum TaxID=141349 RepID=UPI003D9C91E1